MLRGLALPTAMLALLMAGCGDNADDEFGDDFRAVKLNALGERVQDGLQEAEGKSDAELSREFRGYAERLERIRAELGELDPPKDVEDDFEKFEAAVDDVEDSLRDIARAAARRDRAATRTATLALIQRGERLDRLEQQVDREASD